MPEPEAELLVEVTRIRGWRRVAVLDPVSGREAVVHGPPEATESDLIRLARRRLAAPRPASAPPRPGIVA